MTAVVQVNVPALYAALDQTREQRGLTWRQVAIQLQISPSTFSRMSEGGKPSADIFVSLTSWLRQPAETFTIGSVDPSATSSVGAHRPGDRPNPTRTVPRR